MNHSFAEPANLEPSIAHSPIASTSAASNPPTLPLGPARRKFAVYRPLDSAATLPELPDAYFEPTLGEIQRVHAGQVAKRERYEGPLLTRKLREEADAKAAAAKRARFPNTRIRIKFADRTILETAFPSTSQLSEVYDGLQEGFMPNIEASHFVLYQSPPRREFAVDDAKLKGKNLFDLQFAPSSMFYVRFMNEELNSASARVLLRPDLLAGIEDLPAPPVLDETVLQRSNQTESGSGLETAARTKAGTALPKWLKTGKSGHKT